MSNLSISYSTVSFSSLPPEILIKVAFFLTPKNIVRLLTVSKDWYTHFSSNELWSKFCPKCSVKDVQDRFYLNSYLEFSGLSLAQNARKGKLHHISTVWCSGGTIDSLRVTEKEIVAATFGSDKILSLWNRSILQKEILEKNRNISAGQELFLKKCTSLPLPLEIMAFNLIGNRFIVSNYTNGNIYVNSCETDNLEFKESFKEPTMDPTDFINCIEVSEKNVVSAGMDIRVWNSSGEHLMTLEGHEIIECLEIRDDRIFSGARDKMIGIWDQTQKKALKFLTGHEAAITCLKVTESFLISGSEDQTIRVWDIETFALKHILKGHSDHVICLEAIDHTLISCGKDDTLRIWDLSKGDLLKTYKLVAPLCMKVVENHLLFGSGNGGIHVWGSSKNQFYV